MGKNYLKTTFRNLWKNRSSSILNIGGLAIGIACSTIIYLWVESELNFNHLFPNHDYLYQVNENQTHDGIISTFIGTPGPLAAALKREVPGIQNATRSSRNAERKLFSFKDKSIYEKGVYVDSNYFSMLSLNFIRGNSHTVFSELHSLIISEKMANVFFEGVNPVGKILKMDDGQPFTVTGVFRNFPDNTSFKFNWLAPFKIAEQKAQWMKRWGANGVSTFVQLKPGADVRQINQQLYHFIQKRIKGGNGPTCFLFAMNDWHLYNHFTNGKMDKGGEIKYVKLFTALAWVILLIACFNFMNLATARSEKRAREIGVRKAVGASRNMLVMQFIGESLVVSYIAVFLSVAFVYLALPAFNHIVGMEIQFNMLEPRHFLGLIAIGLISGLVAGSYPALYLSSFKPVLVLKGLKIKTNMTARLIRKSLVVAQFSASIILIICTIIVYQQVQHAKNRDIGLNRQNLLYMDVKGQMEDHFDAIRSDLIRTGAVDNVALSTSHVLDLGWFSSDNYTWQGKDPNVNILITLEGVTPQYLSTVGMHLSAGKDFSANIQADSNQILINESLAKLMGKGSQVGKTIRSDDQIMQITGVIKDFVFGNMYSSPTPLILFSNPKGNNCFTIRIKSGSDIQSALNKIRVVMNADNPAYPFEYKFVDEDFDNFFKNEILIGKLATLFSILAIFISCLGLFGLAGYTAERRTKEIGIRKVMGASAKRLAFLLSEEFLQLVGISCLIGFPVAWMGMKNWLLNYEYHTPIYWWIFAITGLLALAIAMVTVSFHSIQTALANPVKSLRME